MLTHATTASILAPADPAERLAVTDLMAEREAPVSDAPVWAPEALGLLLALVLLAPKEPREK
ncbi:MAG TPA: hypothetical protein VE546_19335 [Streptomyces sp.]|uniref:hypothetical protein n=1 Tax=Streptomyces sp. TaxID=1931 RepID=UPI002D40319A|nr:hypothetical protein [Streptomyces sp.]HZG05698.1 hypothetical protein [Streptomyces sp.]